MNIEYWKIAVISLGIIIIFFNLGFYYHRIQNEKTAHGWFTLGICIIGCVLIATGLGRNVKASGKDLSIEITNEQAKLLDDVERSLKDNDIESAMSAFVELKSQIGKRVFPAPVEARYRDLPIQKMIELKAESHTNPTLMDALETSPHKFEEKK